MMTGSSWREWFLEPSVVPIVLKFIFAIVLAMTPTKLCSGPKFHRWFRSEPVGLACLAMTSLLLTLATNHAIGAGAICLMLDTWRKRHQPDAHPLDAGFSIWAISLGILLAEGQFLVAFLATMIPSLALWVFVILAKNFHSPSHLLIRFITNGGQTITEDQFDQISTFLNKPLKQVYLHEVQDKKTYGMAIRGEIRDLDQLENCLRRFVTKEVVLEFEPLSFTTEMQGGLA